MGQVVIGNIQFIVVLSCSFLILMFSICLNREISMLKHQGVAYLVPFSILSFVFCSSIEVDLIWLCAFVNAALLLLLLLFSIYRFREEYFDFINFSIVIFGALVLYYSTTAVSQKYLGIAYLLAGLAFLCAVFLVVNRKKKGRTVLKRAVGLMLLYSLLGTVQHVFAFSLISSLALVLSYELFFVYFFTNISSNVNKKVKEAEKLKEKLEKSLNLEVKKRIMEIEKSNENLITISKLDPLTKALNKNSIIEAIENLIVTGRGKEFTILMFDIDDFKHINDTYGHIAGDMCIRTLAHLAKSCTRDNDYVGRYGGDEFIIGLPGLGLNEARLVAERFRNKVVHNSNPRFSISIGLATYPIDGKNVRELISAADKGLYSSKRKGKNTVSHIEI